MAPLLPYLVQAGTKAAQEIGAKIGAAAWEKAQALYQAIHGKFDGDAYAEGTLQRVTEKPDDEKRQATLADLLAEKAAADADFGLRLQELTQDAAQDRQMVTFLTQIYGGKVGKIANIGSVSGDVSF